ncbi:hypothetical protein MMC26_004209 [Xylographa opegraphella]|nr:hypothetical protein [Xylographa opegraphella]
MSRYDISPPPSKRQRLDAPSADADEDKPSDPQRSGGLARSLPSRPITLLRPNQLRVFSWNINGINAFLQPTITSFFRSSKNKHTSKHALSRESSPVPLSPSLRDCLRRWKWPQVVCLQEIKIARSDSKTQEAVRKAVRVPRDVMHGDSEKEPNYTAHFSVPRDKYNARGFRGKLYGVCTLVRDDLIAAEPWSNGNLITEVPWDLEGRVLILELPSRRLAIFNIYAVNGTDNPYRDTRTGEVTGTRHDRKRAFHTDLQAECKTYESRGWAVIIAGDLNIARSPLDGFPGRRMGAAHVANRIDFEAKFMATKQEGGLGMVDTYRALHGGERKYSYRGRGREWGSTCDRVDLILLSNNTITDERIALVEGDILDEEDERGPSDHLPLYSTIQLEATDIDAAR